VLASRHSKAVDPGVGASPRPLRAGAAPTNLGLGSGRPLRPSEVPVRARAYGHDFGNVRVHDDAPANAAADAMNATAFTWGRHVVLSARTRHDTLAHELAHIVQQSGAGTGTLDVAPAGGALERDAALAAVSGRPPRLRAATRRVQRQGSIMQVQLSSAERASLDTHLGQHHFLPLRNGVAKLDGQETTSAAIAQRAHDEALAQSRVDLIKSDVDRRILNATLWSPTPPAPQYPQTTGQKLESWLTPKPGDPSPQMPPPSAAPSRDDLNKTAVTPLPGDQSMFKRAGIPVVPSQTPDIPLPQPGKDSRLFRYTQLQDRYAIGTSISFGIVAPDGFWKRQGVKKVVLVSGAQGQPLETQEITRDGQTVMWPVPGNPGIYTVMVTVDAQSEFNSARNIQAYKAAAP